MPHSLQLAGWAHAEKRALSEVRDGPGVDVVGHRGRMEGAERMWLEILGIVLMCIGTFLIGVAMGSIGVAVGSREEGDGKPGQD